MKKIARRVAATAMLSVVAGALSISPAHADPSYYLYSDGFYGNTADDSGCSQTGAIGQSQGKWSDWYCFVEVPKPPPYSSQWGLMVSGW